MPLTLTCLPEGLLLLEGGPDPGDPPGLPAAFRQSPAHALLHLAALPPEESPADPALAWLRRFSHQWMAAVCRSRLTNVPPPEADLPGHPNLTETALQAPAFPGSEYLNGEVLTTLWQQAGGVLTDLCAALPGGLEDYLRSSHAGWHPVGRVTFHLAENKRDPDYPFAFLATYTDGLGAAGKARHIPLGRALQTYAAARDQATLDAILTPVRAAADSIPWVRDLMESRRVFQALAWSPAEAWPFIRDLSSLEAAGLILKVPDWWKGGRPSRPAVQVEIDSTPSTIGVAAMLNFRITTTLDGTPLTAEDWDRIKNSPSGLVNLRGQWIEVDPARLGQVQEHWSKVAAAHAHGGLTFHEGMRFLAGFHPGSPATIAGGPDGNLTNWSEVIAGKNLAALLAEIRQPDSPVSRSRIQATLRPYQEKGLAWLTFMRRLGLGACLADDMGLGKTLQVIALLADVQASGKPVNPQPPVLLVVPASLLGNWLSEFQKFAPWLRIFPAHPSRTPRSEIDHALEHPDEILTSYQVVLTTYGLLQRSPALQSSRWEAVILDEAQAIKNAGTAQANAVKKTTAPWRLALTGTPIENRPGDLWSLFDFLNPGLLGGATAFANTLKRLAESPAGYAPLRRLIQPYILRRMKTDKSIIADLPDKTEITTWCPLSRKQAILYGKLVEQLKADLPDPDLNPMQRRSLVVGYLMKFKQVCNHSSHWSGDGVYAPADSGKFQRLAELCRDIADRSERVLIFTQFREIIDPLHAFLTTVFKRPGLLLHGGTPVHERQKLVDRFQSPNGPPFFLLSVKAGGTGLTLTAASHVIHFDRWWNPAVENQATDRAYRIGQKRNVLVHKFVTAGTLEERIDHLIETKKATAHELLSTEGPAETALTELSNEALLEIIALDATAAFGE